jgi:hypothetical protein
MVVEIVGTVGACLLLLAYMLVSSGRIGLNDRSGQLLNLGGSVMLGVNAVSHGAIPPAMLNLIWALIAIAAMIRHRKNVVEPRPPEDGAAS